MGMSRVWPLCPRDGSARVFVRKGHLKPSRISLIAKLKALDGLNGGIFSKGVAIFLVAKALTACREKGRGACVKGCATSKRLL